MLVQRHDSLEHEIVKWFVLIVLACALVLTLARSSSGDELGSIWTTQTSGAKVSVRTDIRLLRLHLAPRAKTRPTADRLWRVIELHQSHRHELAIRRWNEMKLADPVRAWQAIGVSAAHLKSGNLEDASRTLEAACTQNLDNGVTHYLLGVVYTMRSAPKSCEQNRECLRELANVSFAKAIELAPRLDLSEPILTCRLVSFTTRAKSVSVQRHDSIHPNRMLATRMPTIRDLLLALEIDRFEGKSHVALSELCMDRGALRQAEIHLDKAFSAGLSVAELYSALGEEYEANDQNMEAARSYAKAMKGTAKIGGSVAKLISQIKRTLD